MSRQSRSSKRKSVILILLCLILFVLLIIGGWGARRFFPYPTVFARLGIENWQVWEFHDYFDLDPAVLSIVIEDQRLRDLEDGPSLVNGEIYFPVSFIREHIDPFIFWDDKAQSIFISTDTEVIRLSGSPMISADFLMERYPWLVNHRLEYNVLMLTDKQNTVERSALATRRTPVRYRPDSTAFITQYIPRNGSITLFHRDGDFYRVRTEEGLLGYISVDQAGLINILPFPRVAETPVSAPPLELPISLTWEMITAPQGNVTAMNHPLPEGLTVISPTWFNFDPYSPDGTLISFASREYVKWAHLQGVMVWAKVFDTNQDISSEILTDYQARRHVVNQLVQAVQTYNLDGININFEHIRSSDGEYYVQFLRELAPEMRRLNVVLSVATFVPAPWFAHYHHYLIGRTVDFVAIMTYDEHFGGSQNPGPVASLPFVRRSVVSTLELIPKERILLGLPFYNRLWRVAPDGSHTSSLYGMGRPWTLVEEWGIIPVWDAEAGSYYANFVTEDNITYRIWIECERSIGEKLRVFSEYELAGVAGWRRRLETPGVWDEIYRVLWN